MGPAGAGVKQPDVHELSTARGARNGGPEGCVRAAMVRVAEKRYPPGTVQPRHAHATTSVSIVLAGAVRERVGRAEDVGRPLSIVVKPAGTEHANEFGLAGRETHMLQLLLDAGAGAELLSLERRLATWRWEHAGAAVPAFLRLLRAVRRPGGGVDDGVERATFDALAALADGETPPARGRGAPPAWLRPVREALDDAAAKEAGGTEPPQVRALAAAAGVHPVYLARQFRRHVGCSVTEYAQRLRLQRAAARAAAAEGGPLSAVACAAGFFDQAHMCRAFRRGTGMSPSAYRALVGGAG